MVAVANEGRTLRERPLFEVLGSFGQLGIKSMSLEVDDFSSSHVASVFVVLAFTSSCYICPFYTRDYTAQVLQRVSVVQMLVYNSSHSLCRLTSSSTISSSISFSGFFSKSMRIHDSPNRGTEGSVLCVL